ncbi:30S ribosomal protein S17 [bacterium]|nr:30S ribosomal protein S17 [bacterium]
MAKNAEETVKIQGRQRVLKGTVISTKMDKTVVVKIERKKRHPLYQKVVKMAKKYHAHDEKEIATRGDFISIIATRPLSKTKRWRVKEIIEKAK